MHAISLLSPPPGTQRSARRRSVRSTSRAVALPMAPPTSPVQEIRHPSSSASMTGAAQAVLGAAATSAERGSILLPLGISFVTGTLGWLLGGFWWSMAAGAAGYVAGEALR